MLILSQTKNMKGYHGTVGTPTNMYDYRGMPLFVGDVVCLTTYGDDGKKQDDYGIEFVCEEDISIANTYNNSNFEPLNGIDVKSEEWWEKFEKIDDNFRVYKVKDYSLLAISEKIDFLSVVEV